MAISDLRAHSELAAVNLHEFPKASLTKKQT